MEDKKKSRKVTSKKPKEKVVKKPNKKESVKKKKKAFTLIELLAVIIILGILMIIAIPSVTSYINNSRKSAYVDTAKEIVSGARNKVNEGKLDMFSTDTTYYIPTDYIETENASKSPYGEFTESYVGVTYDGQGYKYFWISRDETGQGVKELTSLDKLDEDDIVSDIASGEINAIVTSTGIGNRKTVKVLEKNESGVWEFVTKTENAITIPEEGSEEVTPTDVVCKRATTLHTATCNNGYGCHNVLGIENGATITYGNKGKSGTLTSGDAFDCDVNNDGTYDAATERFYYITSEENNAVLIYYTNVTGGTIATRTHAYSYYENADENWHGPEAAVAQLPTTNEWSNTRIEYPTIRQITNENGTTTSDNGNKHLSAYDYTGKAARLLTAQEINNACGITVGSYTAGELGGCNYLMENIAYYEEASGIAGYWLENPQSYSSNKVMFVVGSGCLVYNANANDAINIGVRPVITVSKSNIDY